jgi:hypothetical protein
MAVNGMRKVIEANNPSVVSPLTIENGAVGVKGSRLTQRIMELIGRVMLFDSLFGLPRSGTSQRYEMAYLQVPGEYSAVPGPTNRSGQLYCHRRQI